MSMMTKFKSRAASESEHLTSGVRFWGEFKQVARQRVLEAREGEGEGEREGVKRVGRVREWGPGGVEPPEL